MKYHSSFCQVQPAISTHDSEAIAINPRLNDTSNTRIRENAGQRNEQQILRTMVSMDYSESSSWHRSRRRGYVTFIRFDGTGLVYRALLRPKSEL